VGAGCEKGGGEATDEENLEKREEELIIVRNSSVLWAVNARSGL
jgi:hypothetical protein